MYKSKVPRFFGPPCINAGISATQ